MPSKKHLSYFQAVLMQFMLPLQRLFFSSEILGNLVYNMYVLWMLNLSQIELFGQFVRKFVNRGTKHLMDYKG